MKFIEDKANVIFLSGVGLGKSHLTTVLILAWTASYITLVIEGTSYRMKDQAEP
jgi:hypothetical protein